VFSKLFGVAPREGDADTPLLSEEDMQ